MVKKLYSNKILFPGKDLRYVLIMKISKGEQKKRKNIIIVFQQLRKISTRKYKTRQELLDDNAYIKMKCVYKPQHLNNNVHIKYVNFSRMDAFDGLF